MKLIEKPWGHEIIWALTDKYVGKILHINGGKRLSLQHHNVKDETIIVISGTLRIDHAQNINDSLETNFLYPGDAFHIPPGTIHRFCAPIDNVVLHEVSTPELLDVVRHADDFGRTLET